MKKFIIILFVITLLPLTLLLKGCSQKEEAISPAINPSEFPAVEMMETPTETRSYLISPPQEPSSIYYSEYTTNTLVDEEQPVVDVGQAQRFDNLYQEQMVLLERLEENIDNK